MYHSRRICAFCFPAVLQTIGVTRWPEVRELYHALVLSRSNKVKQTLACSLHEVARILGDPQSGTYVCVYVLFACHECVACVCVVCERVCVLCVSVIECLWCLCCVCDRVCVSVCVCRACTMST